MGAFEDGYFAETFNVPHATEEDRKQFLGNNAYSNDPENDALWDLANEGRPEALALLGKLANYQVNRSPAGTTQAIIEIDGETIPSDYGYILRKEKSELLNKRRRQEKNVTVMDFEIDCLKTDTMLETMKLEREKAELVKTLGLEESKQTKPSPNKRRR